MVARHNGMAQACCRAFSRCGVTCAVDPHVQQLPKFKCATGLRALPARDDTTTIRARGLPQHADPPLHNDPKSTRASVVPSTPPWHHGSHQSFPARSRPHGVPPSERTVLQSRVRRLASLWIRCVCMQETVKHTLSGWIVCPDCRVKTLDCM